MADWIAKYRATGDFDNSLGEPEPASAPAKAMTAMALLDAAGEPAAVAGIWDERHGRFEIGLDVRRADRGQGLAKPVVAAATRWIFEQGKTAIYTCGATNVRSHRTALSCGFLPLWTGAGLRREGPGPTPDS